jgi:hypothetical protein
MASFTIHVPKDLIWDPKPDITTYELALCIPLFSTVGHQHHFYAQLPPEAQRHWKVQG